MSLQQIAEICDIENIRTARYYLNQILPHSHRRGRGRHVKYPEETLCCFYLLMRLKRETPLSLNQIAGVLAKLSQDQINRVAREEEPLEIVLALRDRNGRVSLPIDNISEEHSATLLIDGDSVEAVDELPDKLKRPSLQQLLDEDEREWETFRVSDRVEVRYKGHLTKAKSEELEIVSRLLQKIIGTND